MTQIRKSVVCLGGLVFCVGLLSGCGNQAVNFNNSIAKANQKLAAAGLEFGQKVKDALSGQPGKIREVKSSYQNVLKVLDGVKADMKALSVPSSASAKKLYDAHQRFLKGQEEGAKQFGEIVKILENNTLNAGDKQAKISQIITQIGALEQKDLVELQSAQREFAKEHNIRLEMPKQ